MAIGVCQLSGSGTDEVSAASAEQDPLGAHDGALHELSGRLELGPPKSAASARTVHLPRFLADLLADHRATHPDRPFVFTGVAGGLFRRANFRQRFWQPALTGNTDRGWAPIQRQMHFHDLRHTHETWLVEDGVPRVLRLARLGHKRKDIDDFYAHVTPVMRDKMLDALQQRWHHSGGQGVAQPLDLGPDGSEHFGTQVCSAGPAPQMLPRHPERPADYHDRQAV